MLNEMKQLLYPLENGKADPSPALRDQDDVSKAVV